MKYNLRPERMKVFFDYEPEVGRLDWKKSPTKPVYAGMQAGTKAGRIKIIQVKENRIPYSHVVWAWHYGEWPEGELRHLNGNWSDDRIENLAIIKKPDKKRPSPDEFRELLDYQPDTGNLIWKVPIGRRIHVGSIAGVKHASGLLVTIAGKQYPAHHIIFSMMMNKWPGAMRFVHANGNKLDNSRENLIISEKRVDKT